MLGEKIELGKGLGLWLGSCSLDGAFQKGLIGQVSFEQRLEGKKWILRKPRSRAEEGPAPWRKMEHALCVKTSKEARLSGGG